MPLLIDAQGLAARRVAAAGPLAPLADALAAELEPLLGREPFIPPEKARMTRIGGWCPRDGGRLEFDPSSPRAHRCPACGGIETAEEHYRMWIMWYQLWLAERAVHGALLFALRGDDRHAVFATTLLERLAEGWATYPNRDNALGPTRLFFSTYLESIWLLQLCIALDLLEQARRGDTIGGAIRDRLIAPSRALIASFDEGASNRQVWNAAALLASAALLGREDGAEQAVHGRSGVVAHLRNGLLSDGTWFEGENYHLFAHRGLWYGVTMAERAGIPIPPELVARFEEGFATPFIAALPDLTLPSRRDSQYAISLRQWRFAELCELGLARREDPRLLGALHDLYESDLPRAPTGRDRSAAEVERNVPATALSRVDLGWRSLLCARETLPPLAPRPPESALLQGQGLAILRRECGRVYAALDYGHPGGGHGHPDRLDVLLADGTTRWLDDPGTGSYVDRSLHWYRSTLAHNAPLIDGRSQLRVHGELLAWHEGDGAGWVRAAATGIAPGVRAVRTLVALEDYLVDVLEWEAQEEITLDLPLHLSGEMIGAPEWTAAPLEGGQGVEDGFDFLHETARAHTGADGAVAFHATSRDASVTVHVHAPGVEWWRATAPAAPGRGDARFFVARLRGPGGRIVSAWSWRSSVISLDVTEETIALALRGGVRHLHSTEGERWRVERHESAGTTVTELHGLRNPAPAPRRPSAAPPSRPVAVPANAPQGRWLRFDLAEPDYRRSEDSWVDAGAPTATVRLARLDGALAIDIAVRKESPRFAPAGAENPFDNEHADIDGDGVQLYFGEVLEGDGAWTERQRAGLSGWMLVPQPGADAVRVRPIAGYEALPRPSASWRPLDDGWGMHVRIPLGPRHRAGSGPIVLLGLIINTITPGRERRSGQLVLGGAAGEWTYLRGDRHAADRLIPLLLAND